ncbi:hypothetical protein CRG98_015110 [Punica granatum]|uniref:Uncharacterized protein n=1 Tax=Punica granatum TaxID=22663 RepID=A0A2I0K7M6_PUNGR|nr:hypothetical protein CRG98_015110 [Punica granatum]
MAKTMGKGLQETSPAPFSPPHHRTVHLRPLFISSSTSRAIEEVHRPDRPIEGLLLSFEVEKALIANVIRCSGKIRMPRSPLSSQSPHSSSSSSIHHRKRFPSNSRGPLSRSSNRRLAALIREECPAPLSPPNHRTVHLRPQFITASASRAIVEKNAPLPSLLPITAQFIFVLNSSPQALPEQ